jgi:hypothetical protein
MRFLFQDPTLPPPLRAVLDHTPEAECGNTLDKDHTPHAPRKPRSKPVLVWVNPRLRRKYPEPSP